MTVQYQTSTSEEIDLVELFRALWRQKFLILGITAVVTLIAAAYAFLATPYYQTRTYLRPAPQSSLDQLNETGIYKLTPEEAINRVAGALSSYDNRLDFFLNNQELFQQIEKRGDSLEQAFANFNEEPQSLPANLLRLYGLGSQYEDLLTHQAFPAQDIQLEPFQFLCLKS